MIGIDFNPRERQRKKLRGNRLHAAIADSGQTGSEPPHRALGVLFLHGLFGRLPFHEIAQRESLHHSTVNELLRLTLLEPAIIQSILAGQQPKCMSLLWFQRNPLPTDWVAQREAVAAFDS